MGYGRRKSKGAIEWTNDESEFMDRSEKTLAKLKYFFGHS